MTKETMTVHKALSELKIIDSRIDRAISEAIFVCTNKHSNEKIAGVSVTEYKERMKSAYQKATDLINRKNAIKRAVDLSNAVTTININGNSYTIVEAIGMKNHGMVYFKKLLTAMKNQYSICQDRLEENSGETLERRAEEYILSVINMQPKDSKMSVDGDAMKELRKTYIENNTYDLIDPLNIVKMIEELQNFIDNFETEVDSALSVSNALTIIEVEY